ncbi:hypothetical protein A3715_13015 [Oleiphilus sp. HI0009]|uniref:SDR family NAD(P)-dependent oxidoreductase n=1 Tax=unclassified Oleiphilus TaxID=2631174 RepID=UPI0007C3C5C6|nr:MULTISPECIES: SDR family NAD(P)-dependent oxidoreductase [unclassified Oleiphilus]KZX76417.1 hypothetical protein A3715_13015 [Oleiphilus sp. HI0009]KZY66869.1 hypothetical protein A3738_05530 [Oleiphilus sp. HI0066]KZY67613.1 hypothetical protein A3739_12285 [Oleiphilus sp. HI0067]
MSGNNQNSTLWVVGASTGIGRSVAIEYARNGGFGRIILSARSEDKLVSVKAEIETFGVLADVLVLDITQADQIANAQSWLQENVPNLSMVIVNAGTCEYMDSDQLDTDLARRVFDANYFAAIEISRVAYPFLRKAKAADADASMVFVSSSVTYQALPRAHAYGASKSALRYFAECLRIDWQLEGIDVQLVSPGFVDTPLTQQNDFDMPMMVSSEDAADKIVRGLDKHVFDVSFPKRFVWSLKLLSWLPTKAKFKLLGSMSRHETSLTDLEKGKTNL